MPTEEPLGGTESSKEEESILDETNVDQYWQISTVFYALVIKKNPYKVQFFEQLWLLIV